MDFIYVDNSNLYIEGRRVSAVAQGIAGSIQQAMHENILDQAYTISFGKLHEFLCGNEPGLIKRVALFGSRPPPNDGIWQYAERAGFELHLEDRNVVNKEKKIDTGIATLVMQDAYKSQSWRDGRPADDTFVLVAGDSDYVPTVKALQGDGFVVEVAFWGHASHELRDVASKFTALDDYLEALRH